MDKLHRIKYWLSGDIFTQLMKKKKTNKYRIAKNTEVSYQSLYNWETFKSRPSDKNAEIVGRYLGLISNKDQVIELERQAAEIKAKLERLK